VTAVRRLATLDNLGSRSGDEMSDADDSYTKMLKLKRQLMVGNCVLAHHIGFRHEDVLRLYRHARLRLGRAHTGTCANITWPRRLPSIPSTVYPIIYTELNASIPAETIAVRQLDDLSPERGRSACDETHLKVVETPIGIHGNDMPAFLSDGARASRSTKPIKKLPETSMT